VAERGRSQIDGNVGDRKRKDAAYRSRRSPDWVKMNNVDAPAMKRETSKEC